MTPRLPTSNVVLSWLNNVKSKLKRKVLHSACCSSSPQASTSSSAADDGNSSNSRSYTLNAIYTPRSVDTFAAEAFGSLERLNELKHTRSQKRKSSSKPKPLQSNPVRVEVNSVQATPESTSDRGVWPLISNEDTGPLEGVGIATFPTTAIAILPTPSVPQPALVHDYPGMSPVAKTEQFKHQHHQHHHRRISSEIVILPSISAAYTSGAFHSPDLHGVDEYPAFPLTHFCDGTCHGED